MTYFRVIFFLNSGQPNYHRVVYTEMWSKRAKDRITLVQFEFQHAQCLISSPPFLEKLKAIQAKNQGFSWPFQQTEVVRAHDCYKARKDKYKCIQRDRTRWVQLWRVGMGSPSCLC